MPLLPCRGGYVEMDRWVQTEKVAYRENHGLRQKKTWCVLWHQTG